MRYLSLAAIKLGLSDLFDKRHAALILSNAGKTYEPILQQKKALIDALPPALTGGRPLADALGLADQRHDGFGAAIFHVCQAYLRWPDVPPPVKAAVERVVAAFIPSIEDLQASYAVEAHAAMQHKNDLVTLAADLGAIPIAGGLTLLDWAQGYITAGESLGMLLSQRADIDASARSQASQLRASTVGILGRFRGALLDEVAASPGLPADLEAQVFAYIDELDAMRAAVVAAGKPKKTPGAPPTGGTP